MALYMEGAYKAPVKKVAATTWQTLPTVQGKPTALVAAQMAQDVNRVNPVNVVNPYQPPAPAPVYNTTSSFTPAPGRANPISAEQEAINTATDQAIAAAGGGGATPAATSNPFEIDLSGIWETAGQMADNEINPQLSEIDRLLQEAGYSADESQRAINEAYPVARRSLQKSIYENMTANEGGLAAMGTGRGGGRQELVARAGESEATGLEAIETGKQRETGAIERALASYKGTLGTQRTSLQGQRGAKQATYAEQLRGSRFNEAATQANYGLNQAQLAENTRQFNANLAQNASQFGATLAENTRQFDVNNTPLPGSTGSAVGSLAGSSANSGGLNYFLNADDLAALGLGGGNNTTTKPVALWGGTGTTVTPNQVNTIQAGKPKALVSKQMQGTGGGYYGF